MKKGVDYIGVSVGVILLNDTGDIFMAKRSNGASNERGCWEAPGGGVNFGETLESAIRREMREEYGIDMEIIKQFPAADHLIPAEKQHWVPTAFLAKILPGQIPKILEPDKCDEIGWFSLDQLPQPLSIITKIDIAVYKKMLASS